MSKRVTRYIWERGARRKIKKQRKKKSPIPSVLFLRQRWQIRNLCDGRISAKDLGVTCSRRFSVFFTCPCSSLLKPLRYPSSASFFCFLLYLTPFRLASSTDDTYYFMSHWSGHTVIKVIMLARWESRRYFYMLVWRNAHLCISVSQNTTWRHSLILLISDPTIILHFVTTFLSHCGSFPKGFPPPILLTSRIFPCFFLFPGPCTSTITTIWQRRRVTVAFCWVVHAALATTRLTTRRITRTPRRPTRSGRRRRRRNPSSTLPRRRPILTATTHPSPVSK